MPKIYISVSHSDKIGIPYNAEGESESLTVEQVRDTREHWDEYHRNIFYQMKPGKKYAMIGDVSPGWWLFEL